MATEFDLIVIGGGPAGYVGAIRAAQLGLRTACVEKRPTLGGTCLNVGCIPSKALLDSSEHYFRAKAEFAQHGIGVGELTLDLAKMMARKDDVVAATCKGVDGLFRKHEIARYTGRGEFTDAHTLTVHGDDGQSVSLAAGNFLIATGSVPAALPALPFDGERIVSSTEALAFPEVPGALVVVGGGAIGLELGSIYGRLGSQVTVFEYLDRLIPNMDADLGKALARSLRKVNITVKTRHEVLGAETADGRVTVRATDAKGQEVSVVGDKVLVAVGRRPCTEGLGLDAVGLATDDRGRLEVDAQYRTAVPHIRAVGDVIAGPMLAHKAEEEAICAVEQLCGQHAEIDYHCIPNVVYTWPEVAAVGSTEGQLKAAGTAYKVGKFPYKASGRARAANDTDGFVKVLADAQTDTVLGVHIIGPRAADLIAEAVVALEFAASAEDLARICHAHPTFAEPVKEAALMATADRPIHL